MQRWERQRFIDRELWLAAGEYGMIGLAVPQEYGGGGTTDYRFRFVVQEEIARAGANSLQASFAANDDMALSYLLRHADADQKARWLPGFATGSTIAAIALTEPGAGSDLRAMRTTATQAGDEWVLNGCKTFISNGSSCDLAVVFAKTEAAPGVRGGFTLFVAENGVPGFTKGPKLDKVGLHAQDTAELFFDDVKLPATSVLGEVGSGLDYLKQSLPLERLSIAVTAQVCAEAAFASTLNYVSARQAFGRRIGEFQSIGFELAHLISSIEASRAYIDRCVREHNAARLSAVDAAKAKYWATEMQARVIDSGVQMHGGYGYMLDYPIARAFIDSRAQRIYGGTNEIMKEIIHRDLLSK